MIVDWGLEEGGILEKRSDWARKFVVTWTSCVMWIQHDIDDRAEKEPHRAMRLERSKVRDDTLSKQSPVRAQIPHVYVETPHNNSPYQSQTHRRKETQQ